MIHGPTYLPPPLIHTQKCPSRHNGDFSYTYTGILSSQSSGSNTVKYYTVQKKYGLAKGAWPNAPTLKYATAEEGPENHPPNCI